MKKNKVLKIVLIVLGALVILLAAAVLGVLFYLRSMAAGLPETLPDAPADSAQLTLTDEELDKLLSGDITLEQLTGEAAASSSGEQGAAASAPQEDAGAASAPEGSGSSSASSSPRRRAADRFLRQAGEHHRCVQLRHGSCHRKTGVLVRQTGGFLRS